MTSPLRGFSGPSLASPSSVAAALPVFIAPNLYSPVQMSVATDVSDIQCGIRSGQQQLHYGLVSAYHSLVESFRATLIFS